MSGEVEYFYAGFGELGEDIVREEQDKLWASANIDGRVHLSHRELTKKYSLRFQNALNDYNIVELLVNLQMENHVNNEYDENHDSISNFKNRIGFLCPENIQNIISFLIPGQDTCNGSELVQASYARLQNKRGNIYSSNNNEANADDDDEDEEKEEEEDRFKVFFRKRPLLQWEIDNGAYDVISTKDEDDPLVIHDGRLSRDGRRLSMCHRTYLSDCCFGNNVTNLEVCDKVVDPLLSRMNNGKASTLIMFGQTGTGKTYTLNAALDYLSQHLNINSTAIPGTIPPLASSNDDIEVDIDTKNESENEIKSNGIEVKFFEIHGKKSYDLLNEKKLIFLRADSEGTLHPRGIKTVTCTTGEEIATVIKNALAQRRTKITERNPISSRSHAICHIHHPQTGGKLTLVDLAGSERNYETLKMTATEHKESADINTSLMALKECFMGFHAKIQMKQQKQKQQRQQQEIVNTKKEKENKSNVSNNNGISNNKDTNSAKSWKYKAPKNINFRAHLLTRVLKACFTDDDHFTSLVVTASPTPIDLEHTINSTEHALKMKTNLFAKSSTVLCEIPLISSGINIKNIPVSEWTADQVQYWVSTYANGIFAKLALPAGIDGATLLSMKHADLSELFAGVMRRARDDGEGASWIVEAERDLSRIGVMFWQALHKENMVANMHNNIKNNQRTSALFG